MIGSVEVAETLIRWPGEYGAFTPEGSTREVFLIDGVIYKKELQLHTNEYEYVMANRIRGLLPPGVDIPKMSLYEVDGQKVIAAEYIHGYPTGECMFCMRGAKKCDSASCMPQDLILQLSSIGWTDTTVGNAIYSKGIYYLIDLGN